MRRMLRPGPARHPLLGTRALTLAVASAAAVAALTACGDTVAPTGGGALSDAQVSADVGAAAGDAIANDIVEFGADLSAAGVTATAGGCPYDAVSQIHVCSDVTENGLTIRRTYQFLDVAQAPTQNFDANNTASIVFTRTVDGTVTATNEAGVTWTGTTHRSDERTVTGLLGAETQRVWNGTGVSHDTTDYSGTGGTRRYAGAITETVADVVLALPQTTYPYPQSGTITRTVALTLTTPVGAAGDTTRAVARTVTVTFNGTSLVPVQVGNVTCTLSLATRRVSGCGQGGTGAQ